MKRSLDLEAVKFYEALKAALECGWHYRDQGKTLKETLAEFERAMLDGK